MSPHHTCRRHGLSCASERFFRACAINPSCVLTHDDAWCVRVCQARQTVLKHVADADKQYLSNMEIRQATHCARVLLRARAIAAAPTANAASAHGRTLQRVKPTSAHLNPIPHVLSVQCKPPSFLRCPDAVVLTLLMLRSAHLPGDYCGVCVDTYSLNTCPVCWMPVIDTEEVLSTVERRWRHVQHQLLACRGRNSDLFPMPIDLHADLLAACSTCTSAYRAVQAAFACNLTIPGAAAKKCVPFLLDPMDVPDVPAPVGRHMAALVAVCVELVAACFADRLPDRARVHACRLPAKCRMCTFMCRRTDAPANIAGASVSPAPAPDIQRNHLHTYNDLDFDNTSSSSDDEVIFGTSFAEAVVSADVVHTATAVHPQGCDSDDEVTFALSTPAREPSVPLPSRSAPSGVRGRYPIVGVAI